MQTYYFRVYTLVSGLLLLIPGIALCFPVFIAIDLYAPEWMQHKLFHMLGGIVFFAGYGLLLAHRVSVPIRATIGPGGVAFYPESHFWNVSALEQSFTWNQIDWWNFDDKSTIGHGDAIVDIMTIRATDGRKIHLYLYARIGKHDPSGEIFVHAFRASVEAYNLQNSINPIREREITTGHLLKNIALLVISSVILITAMVMLVLDFEYFIENGWVMGLAILLMGYGAYHAAKEIQQYYRA